MRSNLKYLAAAATLAIGLGVAGAATAGETAPSGGTSDQSKAPAEAVPTVDRERGVVLEGSGSLDELPVAVTVYDNSLHGSSVQVVLGDPDDGRIGHAEQATPYVVDGKLHAEVVIDGKPVVLSGTVVEDGPAKQIRESLQDGGQQIVTKGTNTPLRAVVQLKVGDAVAQLEFAPAFAFDLEVRKVDLYGPRG